MEYIDILLIYHIQNRDFWILFIVSLVPLCSVHLSFVYLYTMSPAIIFVVYLYIMSPGSMCIVHDIADDSVSTCSVYFCTYIDDNVMCVATPFPFYFDQIVGFDEWEPWPILQDHRGQAVRWSTTSGLSILRRQSRESGLCSKCNHRQDIHVYYTKTWSSLCILLSVLGIRENMSKIYNNYREIYGNLTKMSNVWF